MLSLCAKYEKRHNKNTFATVTFKTSVKDNLRCFMSSMHSFFNYKKQFGKQTDRKTKAGIEERWKFNIYNLKGSSGIKLKARGTRVTVNRSSKYGSDCSDGWRERTNEQTDGRKDRWTDGWTDGWTDMTDVSCIFTRTYTSMKEMHKKEGKGVALRC